MGGLVDISEIENHRQILRVVRGVGLAARITVPVTFGGSVGIGGADHDGVFLSADIAAHDGLHQRQQGRGAHGKVQLRMGEQHVHVLIAALRIAAPQRRVLSEVPVDHFIDCREFVVRQGIGNDDVAISLE